MVVLFVVDARSISKNHVFTYHWRKARVLKGYLNIEGSAYIDGNRRKKDSPLLTLESNTNDGPHHP